MPITDTATLVIACKSEGLENFEKVEKSLLELDKRAEETRKVFAKMQQSFPDVQQGFDKMAKSGEKFGKLVMSDLGAGKAEQLKKYLDVFNEIKDTELKATADYEEILSAEKAAKAYNLQLKLEAEQKRLTYAIKRKGQKEEIDRLTESVRKLKLEYAKAAKEEAVASRKAFQSGQKAKGLDFSGFKEARKETSKLTADLLKARTIGRLIGVDLGQGLSTAVAKANIFAAVIEKGFDSAVKLGAALYEKFRWEDLKNDIDAVTRNVKELHNVMTDFQNGKSKLDSAMQSLYNLSKKDILSNTELEKAAVLLEKMPQLTKKYGISLDAETGKIKGFFDGIGKYDTEMSKKEISILQSTIRELEKQRRDIRKQASETGYWDDVLSGNKASKEAVAAAEKLDNIGREIRDSRARIKELEKSLTLFERQRILQAEAKDAAQNLADSYKKILEGSKIQIKLQSLVLSGKEREAKLLEVTNKLTKANPLFSKEQIKKLADLEMQLYDNKKKHEFDLEKSKNAEEAEKKRLKLIEDAAKAREKENAELSKMYESLKKFKETAAGAIGANSMEGLLLQSRRLLMPSFPDLSKMEKSVKIIPELIPSVMATRPAAVQMVQRPPISAPANSQNNFEKKQDQIINLLTKLLEVTNSNKENTAGIRNTVENLGVSTVGG